MKFLTEPHWQRQHRWRRAVWLQMSRIGLTGLHTLPLNRRWVEIHRRPMSLKNLDPRMAGMRIVQMSDLHYSPVVWQRYLFQYIHWVNELKPHLVVITGDLITGGYRFAHRIATVLSHLKSQYGVICTFGNHDYSIFGKRDVPEGLRRAAYLQACLQKRGLIVLRNQALTLRTSEASRPLLIVGLDDEWSGNIDPAKAFAGIDPSNPIICLNHNPANVKELLKYPWQWMLSGHTHGRQVASSKFGQRFYPHRFRHYTHGYYSVAGRNLYVNRGLSYGQRSNHWCRPEVTVFKLEMAEESTASPASLVPSSHSPGEG